MNDKRDLPFDSMEDLVVQISALRRASGEDRDAVTLWPRRLHLARNADDCIELFIEGSRESFGTTALGRALEFGRYRELRDGREFDAVVVRARRGDSWVRPMGHLAYEAAQAVVRNPEITNDELLTAVGPYLKLVVDRQILSIEQQVGLAGEMIFLRELLKAGSVLGLSSRAALERWTGWDSASRDFKGGRVAVEVKTTGAGARHHWVHPIYQLLPERGTTERVFVFSVGLRVDRSCSYRLTTEIERVLASLPAEVHAAYRDLLACYGGVGFDSSQWRQYELEPGFLVTQPPALIRVDHLTDILRPEAFHGEQVPDRVTDLRYRVSLEGLPVASQLERESVLEQLLRG